MQLFIIACSLEDELSICINHPKFTMKRKPNADDTSALPVHLHTQSQSLDECDALPENNEWILLI